MLFPQVKNPEAIERIVQNDWWREPLEKSYAVNCVDTLPAYTYSQFMGFFNDGKRHTFDGIYYARRRRMGLCALKAFLDDDSQALKMLHETIWEICNEASWSLPAHIHDVNRGDFRGWIDLFAAETGFAFCEILHMLEDKMDIALVRRMQLELSDRIVTPYLSHVFWWEDLKMNWSAVCAGSVGAVFMYQFPEKFPLVQARILHSMDCFLSSLGTDGICTEGIGYWNYGFGFFVYFAQLLLEFTDGRIDLFEREIVKKAARFQQLAYLYGETTISFSDGDQDNTWAPGLVHFLCQKYPDVVVPPQNKRWRLHDNCMRFSEFLRNIFWAGASNDTGSSIDTEYFPDAQWYIAHRKEFGFAAKGGHNDEPHNHNDLGQFILATSQGQLLCDLGAGLYNKAYFAEKTRYQEIHNNSFGHSVPIIDGHSQQSGKTRRAIVLKHGEDIFSLELARAYNLPVLQSLQRTFRIAADGIVLTDQFVFSGSACPITERFVTQTAPSQCSGGLQIGNAKLKWNVLIQPTITKTDIISHDDRQDVCYFIDFSLPRGQMQFEITAKVV